MPIVAALAVLWGPGLLAGRLAGWPSRDPLVRLAVATGAGLSFWPLAFLGGGLLHLRWSAPAARAVVLLAWVAVLVLAFRDRAGARAGGRPRSSRIAPRSVTLAAFAGIAVLAAVTRAWHVRELVLPAWVDSVHHSMIVQLLVTAGEVPATWAPILPDVPAVYHWGFHAGASATAWLAGASTPVAVAHVLLVYGQVLNALTALALYAAARVLFASRNAGLFAAAVGMLVSWFPAYYAAWGRYTQLAGLLLLPAAAVAFASLWRSRRTGALLLASFLLAGLVLVHVRVAFLLGVLLLVSAAFLGARDGRKPLGRWIAAAALTLLLVSPWLARAVASREVSEALSPTRGAAAAAWPAYNAVPTELLLSPGARELIAVATLGLSGLGGFAGMPVAGRVASALLWVSLLVAEWRWSRGSRQKAARFPWRAFFVLWLWAAGAVFLVNLDRLGLPPLRIAPNSVLVISAFLPLSVACGGVAAWLLRFLRSPRRSVAAGAVFALGLGAWGASNLLDVIPAWTILATARDARALEWIEKNVPRTATFAVRSRPWVAGTFAGVDGGCWIEVLTGRRTILPPALYPSMRDRKRLERLEQLLAAWSAATSLDDPALRFALREAGVTHLFLGENEGLPGPAALHGRPWARAVYRDGPVVVYELRLDPGPAV
ncbi:MAG: hypothetical protein IPP07_09155 [Holophagales bacterium]|nr:hypothetical protein [Holophagales bacterium]